MYSCQFKDAKSDATKLMEQKSHANIIAIPSTNDLKELIYHIQFKNQLLNVSNIFYSKI